FVEWQEPAWLAARGWPDFTSALTRIHKPEEATDISPGSGPWQRLAYDELLAGQLALALVRQNLKAQKGRAVGGKGHIRARIA
ncbi:ATP-dependent DNA helicase RecG, partial [Acinetobacter baumannii]